MFLAAWFHDLGPYAIWPLRWYGLSYAAGFVVGWLLLRWLAQRLAALIPPERAADVILCAVMGVVVGGRLGYVLLYEPELLWSFTSDIPYWGLLAINRGGMASHGGMIGVIIAAFVIARGFKDPAGVRQGRAPVLHVLDYLTLIAPPGLMFGRLANFVNGELLGRPYSPPGQAAPWWTVRFPQEVQVCEVGGGIGLPARSPAELEAIQRVIDDAGIQARSFEGGYQLLLEKIWHGRHDLAARLEPLIWSRYPSQLLQAAAEGVVLGLVLWWIARRARLPGVVGCWFLIVYGVLRIVTEIWRLPDANLVHQRVLGLSRGQWLSVAMVVAGLVALAIIRRRGGQKLGGWAGAAA